MALKIAFKNLTIDQLIVKKEDDPFASFPLLRLKKLGIYLPSDLVNTTNHARGTKDVGAEKSESLNCLMRDGWDRGIWPIPFVKVDGLNQIFDRRHTFNSAKKVKAKYIPGAEYERVSHPDYDWLSDRSVLEIAAVLANIVSLIPADTKDHHFIHSTVNIIHIEKLVDPSRAQIRQILDLMGIKDRYPYKSTIERIVTSILKELSDDGSVASKVSHTTDEKEINAWLNDSTEFNKNLETEDTIYISKTMDSGFNNRYASDVIRKMCEAQVNQKKLKVLAYSLHTSSTAIKKDRDTFKEQMSYIWDLIRDVNVNPFTQILNEDMVNTYKLNLEDFDAEIWVKDQIDGETEPYLMSLS
jgi:hypothetical protein